MINSVDDWLKPSAYVPVSPDSVAALVAEVHRLRAENLQMKAALCRFASINNWSDSGYYPGWKGTGIPWRIAQVAMDSPPCP